MNLILGDCLDKLKELPDNSVDSIVTDPPYGLSFMNKKWDYDVPSTEIWTECLRVLKPGGHLLSFAGSRTYHRMAVRIEDAGFEIRDQIMWIYGSGFPKSHNIGKAVDKLLGKDVPVHKGFNVAGQGIGLNENKHLRSDHPDYVKPEYDNEWEGWGTALKPAHEPIVVARKPLSEKSVAENVLKWGTGGLNIDVSRIGFTDGGWGKRHNQEYPEWKGGRSFTHGEQHLEQNNLGRWPANIILDEEAGQILDEQSGISKSVKSNRGEVEIFKLEDRETKWVGKTTERGHNDKGGASRFFYCPKASKKDRDAGMDGFEDKEKTTLNSYGNQEEHLSSDGSIRKGNKGTTISKNNHPTVKPTELMLYLIKLVTPKGGTVLDPFMGSGSTGKAAIRGGFDFVGIEKEAEYIKIAEARINNEIK